MNISLTFHSADYGFITEAIKMRTMSMLESFELQKKSQETSPTFEQVKDLTEKEFMDQVAAIKQEAKAEKARKAPYGYKKDGTPKKRLGRPARRTK